MPKYLEVKFHDVYKCAKMITVIGYRWRASIRLFKEILNCSYMCEAILKQNVGKERMAASSSLSLGDLSPHMSHTSTGVGAESDWAGVAGQVFLSEMTSSLML